MYRVGWIGIVAAGCAPQWEPQYELAGTWEFAEFRSSPGPRCEDGLLEAIEGSPLDLDGTFPPFGTIGTEDGLATLLGAAIPIVIEAADELNPAHAHAADPDAWSTAPDGTSFRIADIEFGTHQACTPCKDEVWVQIDVADTTCGPWPIYR